MNSTPLEKKNSLEQMFLWHCDWPMKGSEAPFQDSPYFPEDGWVKFWIPFAVAFLEWREGVPEGERKGVPSFVRSLVPDATREELPLLTHYAKELLRMGFKEMRRGISDEILLSLFKEGKLTPYTEPFTEEELEQMVKEGHSRKIPLQEMTA